MLSVLDVMDVQPSLKCHTWLATALRCWEHSTASKHRHARHLCPRHSLREISLRLEKSIVRAVIVYVEQVVSRNECPFYPARPVLCLDQTCLLPYFPWFMVISLQFDPQSDCLQVVENHGREQLGSRIKAGVVPVLFPPPRSLEAPVG